MSLDKHPLNNQPSESSQSNNGQSNRGQLNRGQLNRGQLNSTERSHLATSQLAARWHRLPYKKSLLTALLLLALGTLLSQPRWLFSVATCLQPGALYTIERPTAATPSKPPKVIALTIDDGPSSSTGDILAALDRYGVKATFFTISDHIPSHEQLFKQTIAAGHEIGNHLTADEASIRLSSEAFEADLLAAENTLLPYFSTNEKQPLKEMPPAQASLQWLRPGMGFYNDSMVKTAERHDYQLVLGSVFPYDTHMPSSRFASAFILNTVQPGDIIVLHDGEGPENGCSLVGVGRLKCGRGQRTAETLKRILPVLQARGYTITTVTELMNATLK